MNKNWFRNEALFMLLPVYLIIIAGGLAFFSPIYLNHFESSLRAEEKIEPDFNTGYFLAEISTGEINLLSIYGDLDFASHESFKHKYKSSHLKRKITQLNNQLLLIYLYKDQIPKNIGWPPEFLEILIDGNYTRKKLYKKIKQKRIENNWIDEDTEDEKKINEVLDLYIEYGNPFKLK